MYYVVVTLEVPKDRAESQEEAITVVESELAKQSFAATIGRTEEDNK